MAKDEEKEKETPEQPETKKKTRMFRDPYVKAE